MPARAPRPVVCALIERGAHVLVARRPAGKHLAGKWEFPGGKVDAGEAPEAALVREIREELASTVAIIRALPRCTHAYGEVLVEMIPFVCRLAGGSSEPHPIEHSALAWVRPERLAGFDLAAADLPVVHAYLAAMTAGPRH
jgi:8-oxo-dGTP diphosphatase